MLKELSLQEEYKIINNNLYAVMQETGERRIVNEDGCELLKQEKAQFAENLAIINKLQKEIEILEQKNKAHQIFIGELFKCGFCEIDNQKSKRNEFGLIIETYYDHKDYCKNAKKGGNN